MFILESVFVFVLVQVVSNIGFENCENIGKV
jgi:hypothetical protein